MYTGKTEQPCCLCGREDTDVRIDLPPRSVSLMDNGDPIAWRDIEGAVSVYFCGDGWATVRDLVLETGMSPLSRCNAAHASFVLQEDFEALLNDVREEPDQTSLEAKLRADAEATLSDYGDDTNVTDRDAVEARVVLWALEETTDADPADTGS